MDPFAFDEKKNSWCQTKQFCRYEEIKFPWKGKRV